MSAENSGHGFSEGGEQPERLDWHVQQELDRVDKQLHKPESPKEGEEKIYIDNMNEPGGYEYRVRNSTGKNTIISKVELQSLRDQLAVKEAEIARYIAANSILCDSESEVKLANENNRLEIENRKLREALRECIKYVGEGANMLQDTPSNRHKERIPYVHQQSPKTSNPLTRKDL